MKKIALLTLVSLFATALLSSQPIPPKEAVGPVYLIPVNQEIDPFLGVYLKRSLAHAKEAHASMVIFQLNTFGGRVDSALEITSHFGSVSWAETVAYIPSSQGGTGVSWSAGALISFSCDQIIMDSGTSMGAAAPVYQTSEGMVMAEEKVVSALRGQMAALAEKNGYPRSVGLAMVDDDVELYEVETDEGLRLKTPEEISEMERLTGEPPVKGKQVSAPDKLLTLTAGEMETYGISSATVDDRDHLYEYLGLNPEEVITLEKDKADWFVAFLSSAGVTSILIMIGMVALYLEVTSPGFGIPGTVGLISFAVVFSTSLMMGNLDSLELLLFLLGVILLLVEIFIIPGFGVTGIGGIILILLSLVLSRQNFVIPEFTWQWDILKKNLIYTAFSLFGALGLIGVLMILLPQSRLFSRLVLTNVPVSKEKTDPDDDQGSQTFIGTKGTTLTDLRPVGKGDFDGRVLIIETDGEYLDKGKEVEIIKKEGLRIVVKGRSK